MSMTLKNMRDELEDDFLPVPLKSQQVCVIHLGPDKGVKSFSNNGTKVDIRQQMHALTPFDGLPKSERV